VVRALFDGPAGFVEVLLVTASPVPACLPDPGAADIAWAGAGVASGAVAGAAAGAVAGAAAGAAAGAGAGAG
jgi:hypothetical protein